MSTKSGNSNYLLDFCNTDRQREIISLHCKGMSGRKIGKVLDLNESTVRRSINSVKSRAALKGLAPEYGMTKVVPDPFIVDGISTLYNADGKPVSQWVKSTIDKNKVSEIVTKLCDEYMSEIPKYKPVKQEVHKNGYAKKLVVYPIADAHIGMLSWKPETGNDYDSCIAEKTICSTMTNLISNSEPCEECLIENLGDWLHVDNQLGETSRSGNKLDVDGRYAKIVQCGIRILRFCIEYAAIKHKKVTVINCMGNHDDIGSLWLTAALKNIYSTSKNIIIQDEPSPRHYYRYGNTLIGCTHGSDTKPLILPIIMASENPKDWGKSKFRYWHVGHVHHDKMIEVGDCIVESFRAVCGRDAWTNARGYLARRDVKALFFDRNNGEISRNTSCIV